MATDDYLLDQVERSQRQQTRRRRAGRSRRRRVYVLVGLVSLALLILAGPSLLSHSPVGRSIVARTVAGYGLDAEVESARIGWITPLRITGLHLKGQTAGSTVVIERIDSGITISKLLSSGAADFESLAVRGVKVDCSVSDGKCSLEEDFHAFLQPSEDGGETQGAIQIQDATISVTDVAAGQTYQISQANADIDLTQDKTHATFAGVVSDPSGTGGSLQGSIAISANPETPEQWQLNIESQSLPLSVVGLLRQRFPESTASLPTQFGGDASGAIHIAGTADGTIDSTVKALEIRNLVASGGVPNARVWANDLATVSGALTVQGNRVIGHGLKATTDFATATLDGAFSRSLTLVGPDDNPLQWLGGLDGSARIDVDLAAFANALPGVLPLRDGAQIISGRVAGSVQTLPDQGGARSQLILRTDAVRARARGRGVVIEPIELDATVSTGDGKVDAERFRLSSSFASAVGQGTLRSGEADVQIDFGRLSAMLRPLIDISNTTLGGTARGNVQWNASADNVWRLKGGGDATNLMVALPDGRELKQSSLRADVEAVGRWGGQSLTELSTAKVSVASNGLDLRAELVDVVRNPSSTAPMPVAISGSGRVETLAETLGAWLPAEVHDAQGGFQLSANAAVSMVAWQLNRSTLELSNPRVAYGTRWFSQPNLKVFFDGHYAWPSGDFHSESLTVAGDAVSLAVKGSANAEDVDLEIAWRAKLDRIQGSVKKRIARFPGNVRPASFRASEQSLSDAWMVMGDCEGQLTVNSHDHILDIRSNTTGTNFAIVQPPSASAQSQTVGPMPRATSNRPVNRASRVVWSEPNVKLAGLTKYDTKTGQITAEGMQVSSDWLATTLSGSVIWNDSSSDIQLAGPARLRMDVISDQLSDLCGTKIYAEGIHETPLDIRVGRNADQEVTFAVAGNLGWELGEVGGVPLGNSSVPVRLTETTVEIKPCVIPVGQGQMNLAGEVFYRPGPLWLRAQAGSSAQQIRLTPDMTNRWLKYVAPLAANATRVDGTISVELDEAIVVIDNPEQSRIRGRLNIESAQMNTGPLADQLLGSIQQLKTIAQLRENALNALAAPPATSSRKLMTMPAQRVEFVVNQGVVQHERLRFEIDRAELITSGRVSLDGRMSLVAQVPLDGRWLGNDLQNLAGQPVALPISGTFNQPRVDSSAVRDVLTQLGTKAVQDTAENYLQKQLNKSIDKIFGR